ncbi:hypothetical protein GIB67_019488 [Kingdonia uniflora]|uniref:Kinesin motor domain-containing protein n=1 Tax=Kingdonia uniflora TaxID=39325 RepID=A0A7J7N0T2_9MAGN|nr:hypothetical protein GIB67_019488 [Kingdonia uniflora]
MFSLCLRVVHLYSFLLIQISLRLFQLVNCRLISKNRAGPCVCLHILFYFLIWGNILLYEFVMGVGESGESYKMGSIAGDDLIQLDKIQDLMSSSSERIVVSVRLRPLNSKELARNDVSDWECINDNTIIYKNSLFERSPYPTGYTFDKVFWNDCPTEQVYEEAAKEVALSVVSGINSSIFAYGQTSSGKTYTMSGVTECAVSDIYDHIQEHKERAFVLKFSAMEIYNEAVRDLLSADGTPLRLLDDPERGTVVDRLIEETVIDQDHLHELLSLCATQRQIGETCLNENSSRSHQILRLTIESSTREYLGKDNSSTLTASVDFVDLAGSERASQALSAGTRLKEGCHINRSLLTLGTVIRKLSKGKTGHVPYRDSKLTRILQSSLGGNARTAIICTISPARGHVEQTRNTLSFANCAKEVATNAQVNVVMSDKALVKHLQRELARLETELRGSTPEPTTTTCDSMALLREKDLQIEKMEKEIKDLIRQRDLAQSRIENFAVVRDDRDSGMEKEIKELTLQRNLAQSRIENLLVVKDNRASGRWGEFNQHPKPEDVWDDEYSTSELSDPVDHHCLDATVTRFSTSQYSTGHSEISSDDNFQQQPPEAPADRILSNGASLRQILINNHKSVESDPCHGWDSAKRDTNEDFDEQCKEVRCIEMEESTLNKNAVINAFSRKENKEVPLTNNGDGTTAKTYQKLVLSPLKVDRGQRDVHMAYPKVDEQSSPLFRSADLSIARGLLLSRSRSCTTREMTTSSPLWFLKGNRPSVGFEKDFIGKPKEFQKRFSALSYSSKSPMLSRENSFTSEQSGCTELSHSSKTPPEQDVTSIQTFVAGLKAMAKLESEKQLVDDQDTKLLKTNEFGNTLKNVDVAPIKNPSKSPSRWPLEFQRLQREIIELWHICNVSLVHRTYFFLLFKGDPTDSIYMEVEKRRLSFIKDSFSMSNLNTILADVRELTPASSLRALRREREMLTKRMLRRYSKEERDNLFKKWGIKLDSKQRRLQVARYLWSNIEDMNHVLQSAILVAKLVGLPEPGQAPKEMFGLSFAPRQVSRRSFSWKSSKSTIAYLYFEQLVNGFTTIPVANASAALVFAVQALIAGSGKGFRNGIEGNGIEMVGVSEKGEGEDLGFGGRGEFGGEETGCGGGGDLGGGDEICGGEEETCCGGGEKDECSSVPTGDSIGKGEIGYVKLRGKQ